MLRKLLSLILSITMCISLIPTYALATNNESNSIESSTKADSNGKVEIETERDEFSKTFVDENGKFTKEIYIEPIHFKKNGKWETIKPKLKDDDTKEFLEPENTALKVKFPKKLKDKKPIIYKKDNHTLSIYVKSAESEEGLVYPNVSAKTVSGDNKITYQNVFSNMDLRHITLNNEVKEDWIVNQFNGISKFNYEVKTDLYAQLNEEGSITFYTSDKKEEKVFEFPKPVMMDSNIDDHLGDGVRSEDIHYELNESSKGTYVISLIASKEWLSSPERVYPIYIDPSITIYPTDDSYVASAYPTSNYNKEWDSGQGEYTLRVGYYDAATGTNYSYIKFDGVSTLKGAIIDSASLQTYVTHAYYTTGANGIWADRVTAAWDDATLTWNNKPASVALTSTTAARDTWATFDVKTAVQGWASGTFANYGFKLHANGNGQTFWKKLTASESTNKPKLVVTYHYPTTTNIVTNAYQNGVGKGTGYINIDWDNMYGATSYDVLMFNGSTFQTVADNITTSNWTTQNKGLYPKAPYSSTTNFTTLSAGGGELSIDPSPFYSAKAATTRKSYGFKIIANYPGGTITSGEVMSTIPVQLINVPNRPTVTASGYPYSDTVNRGKGWLEIKWDAVSGATGYQVGIYNGKAMEYFNVNASTTTFSTQGLNIWPTPTEISSGSYNLHEDKNGTELPYDPSSVYINANNGYQSMSRYTVRVRAICEAGTTIDSDSHWGYIPLLQPQNIKVKGYPLTVDKGYLDIQWDKVDDAGGYVVEIFDGKVYKSFDVGNVLTWNSKGKQVFANTTDLPIDPKTFYQSVGATQTDIDSGLYKVRVKAYRFNDTTAPTDESTKMSGYRGLSEPSAIISGSIPYFEEHLGDESYFTFENFNIGSGSTGINVTTGNMFTEITDHKLYTKQQLGYDFTRYHNSKSKKVGIMGKGWTFAGSESLTEVKDTSGTLTEVLYTDEDGTLHHFPYNATTKTFTSPKGKYLSLNIETVNTKNGYRIMDSNGKSIVFEQSPANILNYRVVYYEDLYKNQIKFTYNPSNQLVTIQGVNGSETISSLPLTLTYSDTTSSAVLTATTFGNRTVQYTYYKKDSTGTEVKTTNRNDVISKMTSDLKLVDGSDTKVITESVSLGTNGVIRSFADAKNNQTIIQDGFNSFEITTPSEKGGTEVSTYTYDSSSDISTVVKNGESVTYKRDTVNNTFAVGTIDNQTESIKYTLDDQYNILNSSITKKADNSVETTSSTFDSNGNTLTSTDKDGKVTTYVYTYDTNNIPTQIKSTDSTGVVTTEIYVKGDLTSQATGTETTTYDYDLFGRDLKTTYPNNTFTAQQYNDSKNEVTLTDKLGNKRVITYDEYGNKNKVVILDKDNGSEISSTVYDYNQLQPDLLNSVVDGNGFKTSYLYDKNGNLDTLTDALGRVKDYNYNATNKVTDIIFPRTDATNMKFSYTYDTYGNIKTYTRNSGLVESYVYDDLGEKLKTVTVLKNGQPTATYEYQYDSNGHLQTTFLNGTAIKGFNYYDNDKLKTFTQGNYSVGYTYNDTDKKYTTAFAYNNAIPFSVSYEQTNTETDKLSTFTTTIDGSNKWSVSYNEDLTGNVANGIEQINTYDVNGLFQQVQSFDLANQLKSIQYTSTKGTLPTFTYDYYSTGNIKTASNGTETVTYVYEKNNRLKSETSSTGSSISYDYDAVGNRKTRTKGTAIDSFTYNKANQIETKNGVTYTYDLDGNLTQDENYKYEYNDLGQQVKVSKLTGEEVAKYTYDEKGLRISKTLGTKKTEYFYEGNQLSYEVIFENGILKEYRYYQWSPEQTVMGVAVKKQDSNGIWTTTPYHFITNHRGDVVEIRDNNLAVVGSYEYDAYGNVLKETGEFAKANPIRYASYYYDTETKNYYLKARYYNPDNGSLLALDPYPGDVDNPISQNGYVYGGNNPVMHIDPDGDIAIAIPILYAVAIAIVGVTLVYTFINLLESVWGVIAAKMDAVKDKPNYRTDFEVHHIVAQTSKKAIIARSIIHKVNIGVNDSINLISIKTGMHRRLHTDLYYRTIDEIMLGAYSTKRSSKSNKRYIVAAYEIIRIWLASKSAISRY